MAEKEVVPGGYRLCMMAISFVFDESSELLTSPAFFRSIRSIRAWYIFVKRYPKVPRTTAASASLNMMDDVLFTD